MAQIMTAAHRDL